MTLIGAGRCGTKARRFIATNDGGSADGLGELMPELVHTAKAAAILDTLNVDMIHDHTAAGPLTAWGG